MARLPIITQRRDIDVRVVYGQSIFELYQQIQNLLQREAPDLSNFFAEPIVNVIRGEIAWDTRAVGIARPALDLSPEGWSQVTQRLKRNSESVIEVIGKLDKAGRGKSAVTEALRGMLMTPDLKQSLFFVGDCLVLTQWGCYKFGTNARSADLFEQIERQPKFSPPPSRPPATPDPSGVNALPIPEAPITPLPSEEATSTSPIDLEPPELKPMVERAMLVSSNRPLFWWWLLFLLLLLLLLGGIFWKYWQGHSWSSEAALRAEVAELWLKIDKKARECGLLGARPKSGSSLPPVTVSNEEFRERQSENSVKVDSGVNVSLAWNDRADLDLYVKQPDGQYVFFNPCASDTCGTLDVDANRCDPKSSCTNLKERPLENISWRGRMLPGQYVVLVGMYSANRPASEIRSIPFTVQVTKEGKSTSFQGTFRSEDVKCAEFCSVKPRRIAEFIID